MKNSYEKLLKSIRTTLLPSDDMPASPDEIKQAIIFLLSPYFLNQNILEETAIPFLAPEAVNISRINKDVWAKEMFLYVLKDHHQAASKDKNACFLACASWHNQILRASSEYVSMVNLTPALNELSLHDFSYEAFRGIGALIEAHLQPYLKELLIQIRIRREKLNPMDGIDVIELGAAVNELHQCSGYADLFAPPPWHIRLSQWRNMAQHHNVRIENSRIIGRYRSGSNTQEVVLTREELLNVLKRVQSILSLMKAVHTIFFMDHFDEMRSYIKEDASSVRDDIKIFHFASSIATQGFDMKDVSIQEKSINIVIQDVMEPPPNDLVVNHRRKRIVHSSQFIYNLWVHFPLDVITIRHLDREANLRCTITGKGDDCQAIANEKMPFEELGTRVIYTF